MAQDQSSYLDMPGRSKAGRSKRSIMQRIQARRMHGPQAVADYVFDRRLQILGHLEKEPDRLTTTEWAILRRLLRELSGRQSVRKDQMDKQEQQLRDTRSKAEADRQEKIQAILEAEDRADAIARSSFPLSELRGTGLTPAEIKSAGEVRRRALRLSAAAEYLGIPKSRLDTWCREGLISHSFTRSMAVTGAGTVAARHFLPEDLDKVDLPAIEKRWKAIKSRGKLKLV